MDCEHGMKFIRYEPQYDSDIYKCAVCNVVERRPSKAYLEMLKDIPDTWWD